MATFADYEIIEELHRGPLGSVLRGRLPGQAREFAIKVFDPAMMGLLEADSATQAFLDRSALQKSMVERGAGYWARLHELIATPEGAYYVEDYLPLSAEKLAARKVALGSKALHHVVTSVVKGLLELRMRHRRAHGNLKPSNILVASTPEDFAAQPAEVRVLLTDVATEGETPEARADDLRALGELIHLLVLHRPFRDVGAAGEAAWPLRQSAEWTGLGRDAARWRELCSWLLTPREASGGPRELEEVVALLRELTPRRQPRVPRRRVLALLAVPLVLLVLGVTAAVIFGRMHDAARRELAAQDSQWFGPLEQALKDPGLRQAFRADPDLRAVVDELDRAEADHVSFDPEANPRLSLSGYRRTRSALERQQRIRQDLTPEHWKRLAETIALQKRFEERHWDQPATYLSQLVRGTQPAPGVDVAAGIDRFLRARPRIAQGAAAVEPVWTRLNTDLQVLDKTGDKVLLAFADYFRGAAAVLVRLSDKGADGIPDLQALVPLSDRLASVVAGGWPDHYDRQQFARNVESSINTVRPREEDIRTWLDAVDGYALVHLDEGSKPVESLNAAYQKLIADVARQDYSPQERAGFEPARADLQTKIQAFRQAPFLKKEVAQNQGEVAVRWSALQRELEGLRKQWVKLELPREWVASLDPQLPTDSEELNQRWRMWVESLNARKDALDADPAAYKATKKATEEMKAALSELDRAFPKLPGDLSPAFRDAAWRRREQELKGLSGWAAAAGNALPVPPAAEQVKPAAEAFAAWCGKLQALAKDFPLNREILTPADRPDLAWETKDRAFWQDPTVQALVAPDVQRIRALAAVAQASRSDLAQLAGAAGSPAEVALAAWRRLGASADSGGVTPPWPTVAGELNAEVTLRDRLTEVLKGVRDAAARDAATAELKAQGPVRWRRFTNAVSPDALAEAIRDRAALGVNLNEAARLDPPVRFNLALYTARAAAGDPTPNVVRNASEELRAASAGVKDRPGIADLLTKLGRINEPEPMAAALAGKSPPTYKLPVPGLQYHVDFVRVAPKGMRPFYLATTEVSFGVFVDVVSAAGNWPEANALLGNFQSAATGPGVAEFHGPQLWIHQASAAQPIVRFDTWHFDNGQQFEIPKALRPGGQFNRFSLDPRFGGNPTEAHPMQQVPAQAALYAAALVNCRLPTAREWAEANRAQSTPAPNDPRPNRRDETWRVQQNYRSSAPQWPSGAFNGVFWPKSRPPAGGTQPLLDGNGKPYEDYTVFFRPVDAGGGTFVNLIGNVAEFTCDAPEAFEAAEKNKSAADMVAFAKANASRISVIGGSAFSDPELKVDQPYTVNSPAEPYCDVGFRLAFTAPAASPAERLQGILAEQQFLQTNTVAAGK